MVSRIHAQYLGSFCVSSSVVVTLFEGQYHLGLGALVNSLYRHGFRGTIYAGYRGDLPPWTQDLKTESTFSEYTVSDGCTIRFVKLETKLHLTNYKPEFILKVWEELHPDADRIFYFDPDIVIRCRWSFYEEWSQYGVGLVQEVVAQNMPSNHPIRCMWKDFLGKINLSARNELSQYFNGGFVAINKQHMEFVHCWRQIMHEMGNEVDLSKFIPGDRTSPFNMTDQDGLNMAAMATSCPLSTIGPEGMDFVGGGFTMSHAVGSPKPWAKKFIRCALRGIPPSLPDKGWLSNCSEPIAVLNRNTFKLTNLHCRIASVIGRFVRRS